MMMSEAFGSTIAELMRKDERICVLDADLAKCNGTVGIYKEFPERAFDVGIAEQNMASVAAGLSSYGFIPFISSFTPFATRRICDQIAISIAYAKQALSLRHPTASTPHTDPIRTVTSLSPPTPTALPSVLPLPTRALFP